MYEKDMGKARDSWFLSWIFGLWACACIFGFYHGGDERSIWLLRADKKLIVMFVCMFLFSLIFNKYLYCNNELF